MKSYQNNFPFCFQKTFQVAAFLTLLIGFVLFCDTSSAWAVDLGSAIDYAVLGATTVTDTDPTTLNGNLGLWPGTSITGLGSITVNGTVNQGNAAAQQAQNDLAVAYHTVAGLPSTSNLSGQDMGTVGTLLPGVYTFSSEAQLTGTLKLDAQDVANAQFIFQIGSTLTTASNSMIELINGAEGNDVVWDVGSSVTLGTDTLFQGSILALTSITMDTGAQIDCGQALAQKGAVTLDTNTISVCSETNNGGSGNGTAATPEPGSLFLVGSGMAIRTVFKRHLC